MRISDWRSDVCSSDLPHDRKACAFQRCPGKQHAEPVAQGALCGRGTTSHSRCCVAPTRHRGKLVVEPSGNNAENPTQRHQWKQEESRVGKTCSRKCRAGWSPNDKKK